MKSTSFNDGWQVRSRRSLFAELGGRSQPELRPVRLPHDAMLEFERSAEHGPNSGFFPGGSVEYLKQFFVADSESDTRHVLEFEGVYRHAGIYVNGTLAAQRPSGYAGFFVALDPYLNFGGDNEIRVEVRAHQDSRWYSGLGIYRDTLLHTGGLVHIAPAGLRISTPEVAKEASVVEVAVLVANESPHTRTIDLALDLYDLAGATAARHQGPVTLLSGASVTVRQRLTVTDARLWNPETPELYSAVVTLAEGTTELDRATSTFGIRELRLDTKHGLRINGTVVKLRGACIHHDNGILGAATIGRADERRVELLKAAGFNAIRSAHNPISRAFLDACDRLGLLVIDEAFDAWTRPKLAFDYGLDFPEWWERDLASMIEKDFNHPSVIMYSVGNEVLESGHPSGAVWARRLSDKARELDPTRYTTNAINGFISVLADVVEEMAAAGRTEVSDANTMMARLTDTANEIASSERVTRRTEEAHAAVDVAGLNYADARYASDGVDFPNRLIIGSETYGPRIAEYWRLVKEHPHVLGDFTWTGWDYLGEAGVGRTDYPDTKDTSFVITGGFPWLTSWAGDLDIVGHRRPLSYYREIVFGLRREPYIAVQRAENYGRPRVSGPWSWSDSISSWSWGVPAESPVVVEVYSDADEVELRLDGESLGRAATGSENNYRAEFTVPYREGRLEAVAFDGGVARSRFSVASASTDLRLAVSVDRAQLRADDSDLAYISIAIEDGAGNIASHLDRDVRVTVSGSGRLQALGSARPRTTERFDQPVHSTFDGRLLAIVRPGSPGTITVTCEADGLETEEVTLHVTQP